MTALHPRIAAISAACSDVVAVQFWTVGNALYGALVDCRNQRIEGTTVCVDAAKEMTIFDDLLPLAQQAQRDLDEQERLDDIARENREATLFYNSAAQEKI